MKVFTYKTQQSRYFTNLFFAAVIFAALFTQTVYSAPSYALLKDVMVPMRDGVRLATDIYLPTDPNTGKQLEGPFPAVLIRTPYKKTRGTETSMALRLVEKEYAIIIQDVRGRHNSEGEFYAFLGEGKDGYDAVEWVAAQPWCNGNVGTWGASYLAITQSALAAYAPPHLKTMFVIVGPSDCSEEYIAHGGAVCLLHSTWYSYWMAQTGKKSQSDPNITAVLKQARKDLPSWLLTSHLKTDSPLKVVPSYKKTYNDWRYRPRYDKEYWGQLGNNFEDYFHKYPDIPICYVSGWYDFFLRGTIRSFEQLSKRNKFTKLLIALGSHESTFVELTQCGEVEFGPGSQLAIADRTERWFNQFLKGVDQGILDEPPVEYFLFEPEGAVKNQDGLLECGGTWKTADTWPPKGFEIRKFYLQGDSTLAKTICQSTEPSSFRYDPKHPVPTLGGSLSEYRSLALQGPRNQTFPHEGSKTVPIAREFAARFADLSLPLAARHDVLVFETEPLQEDLEVTGWINLKLWVSSEAVDTDFTAKLIDVYPPSTDYPAGFAMNLQDGILRMQYRDKQKSALMTPGEIYPITIELFAAANVFKKGHRIRLDISSSNFPMYDRNPNTGEPLGRYTHMITTVNTIYHDPDHPSHLLLPVRKK